MTSLGYASFFDSFAEGLYSLGKNGVTTLMHKTGTLDWYLFYGPTGEKIHEGYFSVIGKPKKLPPWACGPSFWHDAYTDKNQILDQARKFSELRIPMTFLTLDRPYATGGREWGEMQWNSKFSPAQEWIGTVSNTYNLKVNTWIAPCTWGSTCPDCFSGYFSYIDLSNPAAALWYKGKLKGNLHSAGVVGHKMDRAEEEFPDDQPWNDGSQEVDAGSFHVLGTAQQGIHTGVPMGEVEGLPTRSGRTPRAL